MISTRPATPEDVSLILGYIGELAEYERLSHEVLATEDDLRAALFSDQPKVFCDLAESGGEPAGFALWFYTFSTFKGRRGIYLEDLYVRPEHRGRGLGRALLSGLAARCATDDLARLEWAVLDWNAPAIGFYKSLGAGPLSEATVYRLAGDALQTVAGGPPADADTQAPSRIRPATADDARLINDMVHEFARSQKLTYEAASTEDILREALFGDRPTVFCDIVERVGGPAGFALWLYSFSTFNGRHGVFLEDIYIRPEHRGQGSGRRLLTGLARRCAAENLARLEWGVGNWNTPAIGFYESLGARPQDDWTVYRLTGDALTALGEKVDA